MAGLKHNFQLGLNVLKHRNIRFLWHLHNSHKYYLWAIFLETNRSVLIRCLLVIKSETICKWTKNKKPSNSNLGILHWTILRPFSLLLKEERYPPYTSIYSNGNGVQMGYPIRFSAFFTIQFTGISPDYKPYHMQRKFWFLTSSSPTVNSVYTQCPSSFTLI